jgi:hypothetical protein
MLLGNLDEEITYMRYQEQLQAKLTGDHVLVKFRKKMGMSRYFVEKIYA